MSPPVGKIRGAGYVDAAVSVRVTHDGKQQESLAAFKAWEYLLEIVIDVTDGPQVLVPNDYKIVVDKTEFTPQAVSFGRDRDVYFSTAKVLAERVELTRRSTTQLRLDSGTAKVGAVELGEPEVALLFKFKGKGDVDFLHGSDRRPLEIANSTQWATLRLPQSGGGTNKNNVSDQPAASTELRVDVVSSALHRAELNGEQKDVFEVTVRLTSAVPVDLDATPESVCLRAGEKRTATFLLKLNDDWMQLLEGGRYFEAPYNGEKLVEVRAGGARLSLAPDAARSLKFVFLQPPRDAGLRLHFPKHYPIAIGSDSNALGQIRPSTRKPTTMAVPKAPIIGQPIWARLIDGGVPVETTSRNAESAVAETWPPLNATFLIIKFQLNDGDQQFILDDYLLTTADARPCPPRFVTLSQSACYLLPDDPFQRIKVSRAAADNLVRRRNAVVGWELAQSELSLVFQVPSGAERFEFTHGSTILELQPVATPVTWSSLRPNAAAPTTKQKKD